MKTLFLIRHAKSDWENPLLKDIERPLNTRGYAAANLMSRRLKTKPDLVMTSPAVRASSTALIFALHHHYDPDGIQICKALYDTSVKAYLNQIRQIDDGFQHVFLFGHNPIISDTAIALCNSIPMEMPTCAIAAIRFDANTWQQAAPGAGDLLLFDYPKKDGEHAEP